jgi:hypothetical protein
MCDNGTIIREMVVIRGLVADKEEASGISDQLEDLAVIMWQTQGAANRLQLVTYLGGLCNKVTDLALFARHGRCGFSS